MYQVAQQSMAGLLGFVNEEHPFISPTWVGVDQIELATEQRMKRVGHTERSTFMRRIGCT